MKTKTNIWRVGLMACGIVALLTAGGWAAYECYLRTFVVEEHHQTVVNPDGSTSAHSTTVTIQSDDPDFSQDAAEQEWQQTKAAIAAGNYSLQKVQETDSDVTVYVYKVIHADGTEVNYGTNKPLPEQDGE